jgi:uncharacterized protein YlaI
VPIFTYQCGHCQHSQESFVSRFSDRDTALLMCPKCPQMRLQAQGIERPNVGREQIFGVRLRNGTEVRGTLRQEAPKKRPVTRRASDL